MLHRSVIDGSAPADDAADGAAESRIKLFSRARDGMIWRISFKRVTSRLKGAIASFTFDDFPKSAWTIGGPLLQQYGAVATYYTAGRFCGVTENGVQYYDLEDLRALRAAGHEVGCHTYSHRPSPSLGYRELQADWDRNQRFIRGAAGDVEISSFAYPFGAVSVGAKVLASCRFASSRGIRPGVNAGSIDLGQLRVVRLENQIWEARVVEECVKAARAMNGWLIFMSHDVSDEPSPYGIRPECLDHALAAVESAGIEILPVRHALARVVSS